MKQTDVPLNKFCFLSHICANPENLSIDLTIFLPFGMPCASSDNVFDIDCFLEPGQIHSGLQPLFDLIQLRLCRLQLCQVVGQLGNLLLGLELLPELGLLNSEVPVVLWYCQ